MRTEIIRSYKTVHTWAGVLSGLALFIAFYAGALTMFEGSLERWLAAPHSAQLTSLEMTPRLIEAVLESRPDVARDFSINLDASDAPARMSWRKGRFDRQTSTAELAADGSVIFGLQSSAGIPHFIDVLHRTAGIPDYEHGRTFMGVVSVIYVLALVSGLVIVLPSLWRDFFALRLERNSKRAWMDAHTLMGVTSVPFHLLIALTSVVFCLHTSLNTMQAPWLKEGTMVARGGRGGGPGWAGGPSASGPSTGEPSAPMLSPIALLDKVAALAPGFQPKTLQYRNVGSRGATVRISGDDPRYLLRGTGFVMLDVSTGRPLNTASLPGMQQGWGIVAAAIGALHFGSFGGEPVRWSYFLLGLGGAFVFLSGNILWIESRRRKAGDGVKATRSYRCVGALTVGVSLGTVIGISAILAAGKWLNAVGDATPSLLNAIYYTSFLGSIAWAFCAGPLRSASHLCAVAGLVTLMIPLTTCLAWRVPTLGLWARPECLGVDLAAVAGALIFALLSRVLSKRRRQKSLVVSQALG